MVENEPLPTPHEADAPTGTQVAVKRLFERHPAGDFQKVIRVGYHGLDSKDLILAKACAEHVMSRAESGSGDMMHAMLLRAQIFEQSGNVEQHNALVNAVIQERF